MIWLCLLSTMGSGWYLIENEEALTHKTYFETQQYKDDFSRLIHNVVEYNVKLKSEKAIKSTGAPEAVITENLNRYYTIKDRLSRMTNFVFCIRDTRTGENITNVVSLNPWNVVQQQPTAVYYNQWKGDQNLPLTKDIMAMLDNTSYEIYAAVSEPLVSGDVFYDGYTNFNHIKSLTPQIIALFSVSVTVMVLLLVYLVAVAGKREEGGGVILAGIDRVYTDALFLIVLTGMVFFNAAVFETFNSNNVVEMFIADAVTWSIDFFITMALAFSVVRLIKKRQLWRNTLAFRMLKVLKTLIHLCFNGKIFKISILFVLVLYTIINGVLCAFLTEHFESPAFPVLISVLMIFNMGFFYFVIKSLISLSQIMEAAREISSGDLDYNLDDSKLSLTFADFASDIQSIQGGLKKAVAEAVRGERMKTDLITNVSHDLKTPLTSIVNYVDLLKKQDLQNEIAKNYVEILEEKSARLKQLIEDLVEASKASSGNLAVKAEKVDLHELVMQAVGEFEEKIEQAHLDVRITAADKKTMVLADGKHMWRIVENLLSNVAKYSMPHSRVYVNVSRYEGLGVLVIKNISAFPLDISPDQLTERFVRGDVSRTTEGSGLGLSIAQSLISLQGGAFNIEIDGDLFKVTVEIPLYPEHMEVKVDNS